jgi:hypothetical protein
MKTNRKPKATVRRKAARKAPVPRTPSDAEILAALEANYGLPFMAAAKLNISVVFVLARAATNPDIAALIDQRHARAVDLAEAKLICAVQAGERWAIELTLSRLARSTYGPAVPVDGDAQSQPAQQNVLILQNVRAAAQTMPIEALRALVETIRQQKRGQALPAPAAVVDDATEEGPEETPAGAAEEDLGTGRVDLIQATPPPAADPERATT